MERTQGAVENGNSCGERPSPSNDQTKKSGNVSQFLVKNASRAPSFDDDKATGTSNKRTDVIIVDEQILSRDCISFALRIAYSRRVLGSFGSVEALLAANIDNLDHAVILYCIHHKRVSDQAIGANLLLLARSFPQSPLVLLSEWEMIDEVGNALEQGVRGFIPMSMPFDVAIRAIDLVCAGGTFVPSNCLATLPEAQTDWPRQNSPSARLTERQQAVLRLLQRGQTNRTIARELRLSEGTVKAHVRNIMQKLKAANRTQVLFLTQDLDGDGSNANSDADQENSTLNAKLEDV